MDLCSVYSTVHCVNALSFGNKANTISNKICSDDLTRPILKVKNEKTYR